MIEDTDYATQKLRSVLRRENLNHLLNAFLEEDITDSTLELIEESELQSLGVERLGERKKLLRAFRGLDEYIFHELVPVHGGTLPKGSKLVRAEVDSLEFGKYAVTFEEWSVVRKWALAHGYGIEVGQAGGRDLHDGSITEAGGAKQPVVMVNWYDAVKWCNAKSEMEGYKPVYVLRGSVYKAGEDFPDSKDQANGFRLPTEAEWEWAARGGQKSQGFKYSGSNLLRSVGWYEENAADTSHPVGLKAPNELGIYDLSGNVWEWCWDEDGSFRRIRGGGWYGVAESCNVNYRHDSNPSSRTNNIGVRLVRHDR